MASTMTDVANAAGVSASTVSHVLNGTRFVDPGTHERVLRAIDELGYRHNHMARAVARGGPTQTIGVAISARSNPYFGPVISAIDAAVTALGSTILFGETAEDVEREYRFVNSMLDRHVDGIILAPGPSAERLTLPLLARSSTPAVLVDRLPEESTLDEVGTDNVEPMARLAQHLVLEHGHQRIGMISGLPGLSTTDERRRGFLAGITRSAAHADPSLICNGESSDAGGERATSILLGLADPPTALIAGNNAMMVGALRVLNQRGLRVPHDMAVCSFDDFEWAELLPSPLTSIAQDSTTIGHEAVRLLQERIVAPTKATEVVRVPTTLVLRNSCGCVGPARRVIIPVPDVGAAQR